jgi:hypothetical protein
MESGHNKAFAFLPVIDDEILATDLLGHLRNGLEMYSHECCLTYRRLFRVGNAIRKYFLAAIVVCVILSQAGRKVSMSLRGG